MTVLAQACVSTFCTKLLEMPVAEETAKPHTPAEAVETDWLIAVCAMEEVCCKLQCWYTLAVFSQVTLT